MNKLTKLTASIAFALLSQQSFAKVGIDMDEMLNQSDLVIQGKVIDINYKDSKEGLPHTFVTYKIDQLISGNSQQKEITLRFIGGKQQQGNVIRYLSVSDVPDFEKGESDVLFVTKNNSVICPLVSCSKGRFRDLNGLVTSEDGQPLLLTAGKNYELGRESMIGEIGATNRKEGFSRGVSNATGEANNQVKSASSVLDTDSFVANLKERAYAIQSTGKMKVSSFESSNAKSDFSTPFFKAVAPSKTSQISPRTLVNASSQKSNFDVWEEQMMQNNGGDPVLTKPVPKSLKNKEVKSIIKGSAK